MRSDEVCLLDQTVVGTADRASVLTASVIEIDSGPVFEALTTLGRRAAGQLNEVRTPPSSP